MRVFLSAAVFMALSGPVAAQSGTPLPPDAGEAAWRFVLAKASNNSVTVLCQTAGVFPQQYGKDVAELIERMDSAEEQRGLATKALAALPVQEAPLIGGYVAEWLRTAKRAVSCLHSMQGRSFRPQAPGQVDPRFDAAQKRLTDGTFETLRVAEGLYGRAAIEPLEQDLLKELHD